MRRSQPIQQRGPSNVWPIPRLVDEAIRQDPSLQPLVEVSSHLTPNLSGPIHDIFAYNNFVPHEEKPRISKHGYRNLGLSLCLATKLLEAENLLDWWVHAAFGTPIAFGSRDRLLKKTTEYTDGHRQMTIEAIDSLSTLVVWKFDTHTGPSFSYARTSGRRTGRLRHLHPIFANANPDQACEVFLHEGFIDFAENGYDDASLEDQLRFSFLFAASVVHELTHCFGFMRRGHLNEEYLDENDPSHEHGFSWEQWVFGGPILMSNRKLDPPGPLVWNTWAAHENKRSSSNGYLRMLVPMDWLAGWFRTEFWNGEDVDRTPQETIQFWERSEKRVALLSTPNDAKAKRPFAVFEEFGKEVVEEPSTVHRSKRRCRGSN